MNENKNNLILKIDDRVWWKIIYLTHKIHTENMGVLEGTFDDATGTIIVEDLHIFEQNATMIHVTLDSIAYAKWLGANPDKSERIIGWYHSHNDMGTFFSGEDNRCINMFLDLVGIDVALVSARTRTFPYIQLHYRIDGKVTHNDHTLRVILVESDIAFPKTIVHCDEYLESIKTGGKLPKLPYALQYKLEKASLASLGADFSFSADKLTITIPYDYVKQFIQDNLAELEKKDFLDFIPKDIVAEMEPQLSKIGQPIPTTPSYYKPIIPTVPTTLPSYCIASPMVETILTTCPLCGSSLDGAPTEWDTDIAYRKSEGTKTCMEREGNPSVHKVCCDGYHIDCENCLFEHPTHPQRPPSLPAQQTADPPQTKSQANAGSKGEMSPAPIQSKWRLGLARWQCPLCIEERQNSKFFKTHDAAKDHITHHYYKILRKENNY